MKPNKQYEVLQWASSFLREYKREERIGELLLQHHLAMNRNQFFMNMRETIPEEVEATFRADIIKHAQTGIPLQHLTGYEQFYGRTFSVDKHVLIPRPETEELVDYVINYIRNDSSEQLTVVDVGTGSGIIAITLALELPNINMLATDISPDALAVAKKNAAQLQSNVCFYEGNFLEPLIYQQKTVDILISNPPYIAESERKMMADTVKNFDPELALFAMDDGLAAYKEILAQATSVVRRGGLLAFEIGYTQGEAVKQLIQTHFPNSQVEIIQDINKKDRIVIANLK